MQRRPLVKISKAAEKQIKKVPQFIREAIVVWAHSVEEDGIRSVRRRPGYHDEPLVGQRRGQRSIRLNRAYRLIYEEQNDGSFNVIEVLEVHKHEY